MRISHGRLVLLVLSVITIWLASRAWAASGSLPEQPTNPGVLALTIYIPIVANNNPLPTPTPAPTATPVPTATPTPIPDVRIAYIFFDGVVSRVESDEYAEIKNYGLGAVNLQGWRLNAGDPGQDFVFPNYVIQPGQSCRVYTNQYHPESCGFSFGSSTALWNNSGDCGFLYNQSGNLVDDYCY